MVSGSLGPGRLVALWRQRWMVRHALAFVLLLPAAAVGIPLGTTPATAAGSQDWPTYLQGPSRDAATTDATLAVANTPRLQLDWAYQTGGPIATSTSVVGTTAFVGSWDGYEYAINTTTGTLEWKTYLGLTTDPGCFPSTLGITSAAAVLNGVVYVGGGGPYFYALNAATGAIRWKVYTGDNSQAGAHYNWSSPLVVGGYAYVGIASNCDNPLVQGRLLQVDTATGTVVHTHNFVPDRQVGGGVWTSPAYDAATKTIFVSTGTMADYTQTQSQAIVALSASNLAYKGSWQLPFAAAIADSDWSTTPTLTTGVRRVPLLSVANKNGVLYTFRRNHLAAGPIWRRQIALGGTCPSCGDGTMASGDFAGGVLYYAGGHNVQGGHGSGGSVTALNPGTGAVLWSRQTDQPVLGSPAYVNGMVAEVEGSTFEVLEASNGHLLYSYVLPQPVYGSVSVAHGQFYVGALDGKLFAFGPAAATPPPPPDPRCPGGFTCQDIGNPGAGSEQTTGGVLTVTAAGSGTTGPSDQFRFISAQATGNSQASARITGENPQAGLAQQDGLMVRQSAVPGSPYYAIMSDPNDSPPDLKVWYRAPFAASPVLAATWPAPSRPFSVMVQRRGNLFSAGISADGATYTLIPGSTADLDLPATTMQGVAVGSGSPAGYGTASFTSVTAGAPVTTSMAAPPPADPCPSGWTCTDLGNPAPPGDTTGSPGSLTLAGTGTGFGGASDSAHYVYQTVSGNYALSAQVATQPGAAASTQDGLMMRASTSPTAPMYSVYLNPGGPATIQWRSSDGIAYVHNIPLPAATSPAYLQIVRWQDHNVTYFSTLTSPDGTTWTPVLGSAIAIDMGKGPYLAGLAATTGTNGATTPARFAGTAVSAISTPPAGICPSGFGCTDVGTPAIPTGNQLFASGRWTVRASGDIDSVYDEFRFIYQAFPATASTSGDGRVGVHVTSQAGGGPWMRSGVMIRSGTGPQAPYYGVFVTPGHGVVVQWRSRTAGATHHLLGPAATTPVWLDAARYTAHGVTYYSAYSSADGAHFTLVPGSTVKLNLPGPLAAGIASDANGPPVLAVSTFDNLAQSAHVLPPGFCPAGCPTARLTARLSGSKVIFNGSRSASPMAGSRIVKWIWHFGDGKHQTTYGPTVIHSYPSAPKLSRTYRATLQVVTSEGAISPIAAVTVIGTATSFRLAKTASVIRVSGLVLPNRPGEIVHVLLLRFSRGAFRAVANRSPALTAASRFRTRFTRPPAGACRIEVSYAGDRTHLGSMWVTSLAC